MLTVMVARSEVYNAECAIGVVSSYKAALLKFFHYLVELFRSGRYHLQYTPGIILCREECLPFLLTEQEGMYFI